MGSNAANKLEEHKHEMLWFVARGNILKGPFTTEELQNKVRKKDVSFLDYCWRQGFREWRPIGSIEDFDRRGRLRALPEYPNVAVPGGGSLSSQSSEVPTSQPTTEKTAQKHRKFQVTLARTRRHSITIYEWGFCALFSLAFAFFSTQFALNEVQMAVGRKLSMLAAGRPVDLNVGSSGMDPQVWAPMFSAPGFRDFEIHSSHERMGFHNKLLDLNVQVGGVIGINGSGQPSLGGFPVAELPTWVSDTYMEAGVDPVYIRPRHVSGHLPVRSPASLEVHGHGEPYLH